MSCQHAIDVKKGEQGKKSSKSKWEKKKKKKKSEAKQSQEQEQTSKAINNKIVIEHRRNLLDQGMGIGDWGWEGAMEGKGRKGIRILESWSEKKESRAHAD